MKHTYLDKLVLAAATLAMTMTLANAASADRPGVMCDQDAEWTHALDEASVVVIANGKDVSEKNDARPDGGWSYSFEATYEVAEVLVGVIADAEVTLKGGCSGLRTSSRNHCVRPPGGTKRALFLSKDAAGWHLVARAPAAPCPSADDVKAAKTRHAALFARLEKNRGEESSAALAKPPTTTTASVIPPGPPASSSGSSAVAPATVQSAKPEHAAAPTESTASGCGCTLPGRGHTSAWPLAGLALMLASRRRRKG